MTRKPDWMERRELMRLSAAGIMFAACTREANAQMRDGASAKIPANGRKVLLVFASCVGEPRSVFFTLPRAAEPATREK